jgi:hypothetical protein
MAHSYVGPYEDPRNKGQRDDLVRLLGMSLKECH